ncbi:MAG: peptidase S8, partial [Roseiflexus castenholzii]
MLMSSYRGSSRSILLLILLLIGALTLPNVSGQAESAGSARVIVVLRAPAAGG